MRVIKCNLPYAESIELHTLADLHIGDFNCDYKGILERIDYIKRTPNAYCILENWGAMGLPLPKKLVEALEQLKSAYDPN